MQFNLHSRMRRSSLAASHSHSSWLQTTSNKLVGGWRSLLCGSLHTILHSQISQREALFLMCLRHLTTAAVFSTGIMTHCDNGYPLQPVGLFLLVPHGSPNTDTPLSFSVSVFRVMWHSLHRFRSYHCFRHSLTTLLAETHTSFIYHSLLPLARPALHINHGLYNHK